MQMLTLGTKWSPKWRKKWLDESSFIRLPSLDDPTDLFTYIIMFSLTNIHYIGLLNSMNIEGKSHITKIDIKAHSTYCAKTF